MVEIPIEEATVRSKQLLYIAVGTLLVGLSLLIYLTFNIFDRRRYERNLLQAKLKAEESNKLKTAFLNNISHEIRTPLNGILGFTELITESDPSEKQLREYREILRSSSNHLLSSIDNILELSKIQTSKIDINITFFDIEKTLSSVISDFNYEIAQKSLALGVKFPAIKKYSEINTDEYKFRQILTNLISNAIKFTKSGGVEVGYSFLADSIEFFVKDTGVGIKPENAKRIFQFFTQEDMTFSRNFGGLGIGLSIAKFYTELLGGRITFVSEPDSGTTFFFTIPIQEKSGEAEVITESKLPEVESKSVLIVEDEEFNLYLLKEIISTVNVRVLCASNGAEAVELCKKDDTVAIVLMDIRMPVMNGFEATKIIKSFRPDLPIVAVTAFTQVNDSSQKIVFDSIITKPYVKEEILRIISTVINLDVQSS
jgi:signal transduction histidine kinase/CheY-like chemotaxis protein